jgi:2-oxoglutarate dehydrogenase E2 component (dihydrolipoamide succinyltransferase)
MKDQVEITLPKLGESIVSATVVQWFKKVGDPIALDEPLLEVSTDKVNSEIPSPVAGVLEKILAEDNQEVQVGEPLALITTGKGQSESVPSEIEKSAPSQDAPDRQDLFSPVVLRYAKEIGVGVEEFSKIPRTGSGNRLTKKDIEEYAQKKNQVDAPLEGVERVQMTPIRKAIAQTMVRSFYQAPHASLITEVDVTDVMQLIKDKKQSFLQEHGVKLSITSFVARAIARSVQSYPLLNSSLDGDTILMKRYVNLGIAVSVHHGVIVPVIRNCQDLSLIDIAKYVAELAEKARDNKLDQNDVKEGSITMTNFGMTGTMIGIPIIRFPEVAIVGLGAIQKKVAVIGDDQTAIRSMMHVSLTFDHRVIDGIYGCEFLNALKQHLEKDVESTLS